MNIEEKFIQLIEDEVDVLDFLKGLSKEERKKLGSTVKKLYSHYIGEHELEGISNYKNTIGFHWETIRLAGYFCFDKRTFRKYFHFFYEDFYTSKLAHHFRPTWFNAFIHEYQKNIKYEYLVEYLEKGWITPTVELSTQSLAGSFFSYKFGLNHEYNEDVLYLHPITLSEHIWQLFTMESPINYSPRVVVDGLGDQAWFHAFRSLLKKEKIDRQRVLKECLLTSTRNLNRTLSGWFVQLLDKLNPTKEELILLQNELFLVSNSIHSKPINASLKYIKQICTLPKFNTQAFLDTVPTLFTSDVKSVLNSTLAILEKLNKNNSKLAKATSLLVVQLLASQDEKIQTKAANFILKHGDKILKDSILVYYSDLFTSVKKLLLDFAPAEKEDVIEAVFEVEALPKIREDNQVDRYETIEKLIFFFSQVFENNAPYHFDLFVDLLPKLNQKITEENVIQLEPAFQRALKTTDKDAQTIGYVELLLAKSFLNYVAILFERFPNETKRMQKAYQIIVEEDVERREKWVHSVDRIIKIEDIKIKKSEYQNNFFYKPFLNQLIFSKGITLQNKTIPVLATVTHTPCWIAFEIFIEKLKNYQEQNESPNLYDFQIALSRLVYEGSKQELELIKNNIQDEFKDILNYLVSDSQSLDLSKVKHPSYWMMALYRKNIEKDLETFLMQYDKENAYSFLKNQTDWEIVSLHTSNKKAKHIFLKVKDLHVEEDVLKSNNLDCYLNFYTIGGRPKSTDEQKLLFLTPNKPDHYLYHVTYDLMRGTKWSDAESDRSAMILSHSMIEIWDNFNEKPYVYLAASFFFLKKPTRQMIAEIWIQAVAQDKINSALLGKTLGRFQKLEYAPMKRFSELVLTQMLNISSKHNEALELLISHMIANMATMPVKGTKKLLEIYVELLSLNDSQTNDIAQKRLLEWQAIGSLKKVIKNLI